MQSARLPFPTAPSLPVLRHASFAWALTAGVVGVDAIWFGLGRWSIPTRDLAVVLIAIAGFFAPLAIGRYRRDLRLRTTLHTAALLIAFQAAAATLSYLVTSTGAPLVDARLAAWDRALGFDWLAAHRALQAHPLVTVLLQIAYDSGMAQLVFVILFLGFTARPAPLAEFMRLFIAATLIVVVLSGLFPAAGAWKYYDLGSAFDLSKLSHFEALRNGGLRDVSFSRMQGLISMPSLHAAMAVLLAHAMRSTVLFPMFLGLNLAMLAATPIDGGHYLVDVLAGVALALALVAASRRAARRP